MLKLHTYYDRKVPDLWVLELSKIQSRNSDQYKIFVQKNQAIVIINEKCLSQKKDQYRK